MNKERDSGTVLPVEVRKGRVVGGAPEQDLNEMRAEPQVVQSRKHLVKKADVSGKYIMEVREDEAG